MISVVSKAPTRISFLGGGTDHPQHFLQHGGAVISTSIDLPTVITVHSNQHGIECISAEDLRLKHLKSGLDDIVDAVCKELNCSKNVTVFVTSTARSGSGLGTSSSLIVGLASALCNLNGVSPTKKFLAETAIRVERERLGWTVGYQDQIACAFGGLNFISFNNNGFDVHPLRVSDETKKSLYAHMMLFQTNKRRRSSDIEVRKIANFEQKREVLARMSQLAYAGRKMLEEEGNLKSFMELTSLSWDLKKQLDPNVSTPEIDYSLAVAEKVGAFGGKILGAGGGGALLIFCPENLRTKILYELSFLAPMKFGFDECGVHSVQL